MNAVVERLNAALSDRYRIERKPGPGGYCRSTETQQATMVQRDPRADGGD
jgi:hypothetical protein